MAQSMLTWMKSHEKRYQTRTTHSKGSASSTKTSTLPKPKSPQRTIDTYLPVESPSSLFDESFNQCDFKLVTKRWLDKNQSELAAN